MSMYGELRLHPDVGGPSLTVQTAKDECDINKIMARYVKTGLVSHMARGTPRFMDVSEVGDYRSALEQLRLTNEFFAGLPAEVRREYDNDPALFLDAMDTPEGVKRLEELSEGEVVAPPKVEAPPAQ